MDNSSFKSAFIALIGRPNSGKSTLMNTIIGEQLSIVTSLPQTTRNNLKGIFTDETMQLIFVDTPGIHYGKYVLNESMISEATKLLTEKSIDLVCYLVDLSRDFGDEEKKVGELIGNSGIPLIILFNKMDVCKNTDAKVNEFFNLYPHFKHVNHLVISAAQTVTKELFLKTVQSLIHEGPKYFEEDNLTDASLRYFAAEYIRKQIILNAREEVPHAACVEIEQYKEQDHNHFIIATIHVETIGQRGILVGKKGSVIGAIREAAEKEMSELVDAPVKITCHIKVTPGWRNNAGFLRLMGYTVGQK